MSEHADLDYERRLQDAIERQQETASLTAREVSAKDVAAWRRAHPDGLLLSTPERTKELVDGSLKVTEIRWAHGKHDR
jgi:hypothetical protein